MTITKVEAAAYTIPTDSPEADGTLQWNSTTLVTVVLTAGDIQGLGWTYASKGAVAVVEDQLASVVMGAEAHDVARLAEEMARACRNLGRPGIAACAISAVDIALWDLHARQLNVSLVNLFGSARVSVPVYGSGGFTSYDDEKTAAQLSTWAGDWGIPRVKIKIGESWGTNVARDLSRVALARRVVGESELYVDANGAYTTKQAIRVGETMTQEYGVAWFEEPVSSDDLTGMGEIKANLKCDIAAGEYGYTLDYFANMISANAVDCLQADVTRCGGYSVWRQVAALAQAHNLQISGHCAPNLHASVAAAVPNLRHVEYFHDHHRIETMLFDGTLAPNGGSMTPDRSSPGHGLSLRKTTADDYQTT